MYDALDIAKYIICYYITREITISNLKLQKLLFYIQVECLKRLNYPCFKDEIQAWKLGPVVPEVYYEYNIYLAGPILSFQRPKRIIDIECMQVIQNVLEKYKDSDAWEMVKLTHKENAWIETFKKDVYNTNIPIEKMR